MNVFLGDDMHPWAEKQSEATERIELSTLGLQDQCSTTELSSQLYWKQSVELCGQLGRVAQSVERRSDKAKVLGSSPSMTRPIFSHGSANTPAWIRTRVARFKVWSADHYTTGASNFANLSEARQHFWQTATVAVQMPPPGIEPGTFRSSV